MGSLDASDAILWQQWQRDHDPGAFAEIVSRHSGMVYAACKRVLRNAADAEEIAQDCFCLLLNERVTVQGSLAPWLYTVAVRRAINRAKAELKRRQRERRFTAAAEASPYFVVDDLLDHVDAAISSLPPKYRAPLILRYLEGHTYSEIARTTGIAESTVRYRAEEAIARVRSFLKRRGIPIGAASLAAVFGESMAEAAPPTLVATLGKLMIAGTPAPIAAQAAALGAAGAITNAIGKLLIMKKIVFCVAVVAAILAGLWITQNTPTVPPEGDLDAAHEQQKPSNPAAAAKIEIQKENDHDQPPETPAAPAQQPEPAPPDTGIRVAGIVVDLAGEPAPGARVISRSSGLTREETFSAAGGVFALYLDVACNDLLLQAEKDSYESPALGPSKLRDEGLEGLVLQLSVPRNGSIAGVVVDRERRPVPDLLVNAHGVSGIFVRRVDPVRTGPNGSFTLTGLPPDQYAIVAGFYARAPEVLAKVSLAAGQALSGLEAVMDLGPMTIAGVVVDTDGKPVPGAEVLIHNGFGGDTSDEQGRYEIKGLAEGTYMLDAVKENYSWSHRPNVAAGATNVELVLLGEAAVEGRVVRADTAAQIQDFDVFHAPKEQGVLLANRRRVSDADGRFTLTNLDVGEIAVTVQADGFAPLTQALTLTEHATARDIVFSLAPGNPLRGRVQTVQGNPVPGAYIYAGPLAGWMAADTYIVRSDAQGLFQTSSMAPDTRQVSAYHPDFAPALADVVPGSDLCLVMQQAGRIAGKVTRDGKGVPGIAVMVTYQGEHDRPAYTKTDGEGAYVLDGLVAGTSMVIANAQRMKDGGAMQQTATIEPGQTTQVDFVFQAKKSRIEGHVTVAGQPAPAAKLALLYATAAAGVVLETETAPDGSYQFSEVAAGEAIIAAELTTPTGETLHRGTPVTIDEDAVLQQDIAFATGDTGAIAGQILGKRATGMVYVFAKNTPLPDMSDVLAVLQYTIYAYSAAECAGDGSYNVPGLPPGAYHVLAVELPQEAGDLKNVRMALTENVAVTQETVTVDFDFQE